LELKDLKDGKDQKDDQDQPMSFDFEDDIYYKEVPSKDSLAGYYKYAISFWKLNKGKHPLQVKEYGFNGSPAGLKFYISHDAKYLFFFLSVDEESTGVRVKRMVVLDITTLKEHTVMEIPAEPQLSRKL
jgi:hypothetical protein